MCQKLACLKYLLKSVVYIVSVSCFVMYVYVYDKCMAVFARNATVLTIVLLIFAK